TKNKKTDDTASICTGGDNHKRKYSIETWRYEGAPESDHEAGHEDAQGGHGKDRGGEAADVSQHALDPTLQHPRCVFQLLKRHYARYTPEMVERVCGVPRDRFLEVADVFTSASGPDKTAAICYAVGWTQHSVGVQMIRTAAILQLL